MSAKRATLWQCEPDELVIVGLDTKDGPEHELWDERIKLPLDETMIDNIMALGVKESVTVRKSIKGLEVVNGRRRVLHAREANKRLKKAGEPLIRVPATVESGDGTHMGRLTISLNEIRKDDDALIKAEKCIRLLQRNGNDQRDAAVVFGVSVATIKNWAKLAELSPTVKKAVRLGEISASAAVELHGSDPEAQQAKLKKLTESAKESGKKRASVNRVKQASGRRTPIPKRVLMRLIDDTDLASIVSPDMVNGIKLALGSYVPGSTSKLGRLLAQAGYKYE